MKNQMLLYFHKIFTMKKNNNTKNIRQLFEKRENKLKVKRIFMIGL